MADTKELTERQKNWIGALSSIGIQTALFWPAMVFLGNWIAALLILVSNLVLAASYKSTNPYLKGARWATFWALGLASLARHHYWYVPMLESFLRLRDFNAPVEALELFCKGTVDDMMMIVSTSLLIIAFYWQTTKWPEWTDRWNLTRRAPFSASLGFQVLIMTAVIYPTALTLSGALFFAGIISPIIRRQIRLNHVVFLMLTPLFSLGCPPLALFWAILCGLLFLYAVVAERSMNSFTASFTFFNGVVFTMVGVAMIIGQIVENAPGLPSALATSLGFLLAISAGLFLLRNHAEIDRFIATAHDKYIPLSWREASYWKIRDGWVDQEVNHRDNRLYYGGLRHGDVGVDREFKLDMGTVFFGPKYWVKGQEEAPKRFPHPPINYSVPILALAFFGVWFMVDMIVHISRGDRALALTVAAGTFLAVLTVPLLLMGALWLKKMHGGLTSLFTAGLATCFYSLFMLGIILTGVANSQQLQEAANQAQANQDAQAQTSVESAFGCSDREIHELFNGRLFS